MTRARALLLLGVLCSGACSQSPLPASGGDLAPAPLVDAAASDAAPPPADLGDPVGVQCGAAPCDTPHGNVCCESPAPTCMPAPCAPGTQTTGCDGPEDCKAGEVCCLYVAPFFGSACAATCRQGGDERGRICHTAADCEPHQSCVPLEVSGGLEGCFGP